MSESPAHPSRGSSEPTPTAETTIVEARLRIDDRGLDTVGVGALVSLLREAGLREFNTLSCGATGATVKASVEQPLPKEKLAALDRVDRWADVSDAPGVHLYVVEFTAPEYPPSVATQRTNLLDSCNPELEDEGLLFSVVGPPESVSAAIDDFESDGLTPRILRVGPYTGLDRPLDALTERQCEVVRTAYELGYYEVPRSVSSDEVAAELGLEASTVSEHLQRAERNFIARQLSPKR